MVRRLLLYVTVLAIVVIPVSMTCWKVVQYARVSKAQIVDLHHHIVRTLALNTTSYFNQLNIAGCSIRDRRNSTGQDNRKLWS